MPQHQGFGHLTLTVTDLERSADFYNRVLGSTKGFSHGEPGSM